MNKLLSRAIAMATGCVGILSCVASAQAADVLISCANEGQTCIVPNASTTITYGKNGATLTTVGVTQINCTNDAFKGDPLRGKDKVCTYTVDPTKLSWTQCAKEGGKCSFTGAKLVRYGATKWVYSSFVNGVSCNNSTFGDSDRGNDKICQVAGN